MSASPEVIDRRFRRDGGNETTSPNAARRAAEWRKVVVDGRSRKRLFWSWRDRVAACARAFTEQSGRTSRSARASRVERFVWSAITEIRRFLEKDTIQARVNANANANTNAS